MSRTTLSKPLQHAHKDGLLDDGVSVFDYGCGRGDDVRTLSALGLVAHGWDPAHAPGNPILEADVVNIGYVVNVIEDPDERAEALRRAWGLARTALIVAGRLAWEPDSRYGEQFGDGRLTKSGTFQKFYLPEELKAWIEATLGNPATTAAPGVYYVFRDEAAAQRLLARHTRLSVRPRQGIAELLYEQRRDLLGPVERYVTDNRRVPSPADIANSFEIIETFGSLRAAFSIIRRVTGPAKWSDVQLGSRRRTEERFEEHLEYLQPLMDFVAERGRLPREGELSSQSALCDAFGSVRAAFSLIRRATGPDRWAEYEKVASDNFLVFTALSAFRGRPKFGELPNDLQHDAKDLFGSYAAACVAADQLLHSLADTGAVNDAIRQCTFGKLTAEALYVHALFISELPPLLRVYEGAARIATGDVDDATIIKLNRLKPQVSFLVYPDFETDPHPALEASIVSKLGERRVKFRDFSKSTSPPILHRKELFVPEYHASRPKFARLTRQEERAGLLDLPDIGTRSQWEFALKAAGYKLNGHRLTRL